MLCFRDHSNGVKSHHHRQHKSRSNPIIITNSNPSRSPAQNPSLSTGQIHHHHLIEYEYQLQLVLQFLLVLLLKIAQRFLCSINHVQLLQQDFAISFDVAEDFRKILVLNQSYQQSFQSLLMLLKSTERFLMSANHVHEQALPITERAQWAQCVMSNRSFRYLLMLLFPVNGQRIISTGTAVPFELWWCYYWRLQKDCCAQSTYLICG